MKKALRFVLYMLAALFVTAAIALVLIVKLVLAPATGEWSERVSLGPIGVDVGVPTVLRLVTASWFAPQLAGHTLDTRFGTVQFGWNDATSVLEAKCAPCTFPAPDLGEKPVRVDQLSATVRRDVDALFGALQATPAGSASESTTAIRGRWTGRLSQKGLQLAADIEDAPIAQWYQILVPQLPELQRARIAGTASGRVQLALPEETFSVQPRLTQFTVEGLGAEAMIEGRSCGAPSKLTAESWLARAVVAAQDADFYDHSGFLASEFGGVAALPVTRKAGKAPPPERPKQGSLDEQLARLLLPTSPRILEGKLRDLLYAVEMDRAPGKSHVLVAYLDNAPWGDQACGAEAAARLYFKRGARALTPSQSVWLAAMVHDPKAALEKWRKEGKIDTARTKSVSEAVRNITPGQRNALLRSVASAQFAPP